MSDIDFPFLCEEFMMNKKKYVKSAALCHCLLHILVSIGASLTYRDYYLQNIN